MTRADPSPQPARIGSREAAVEAAVAAVAGARRNVWARCHALEPWLYDDRALLQALRGFAVSGRGNEVRILLHDAAAPQRAHAPLLALAQRLPSVFLFRELVDPVDRDDTTAFLAGDGGGYFLRGAGERIDGEAESHAPARVRQLRAGFEDAWERSRPVTEYRALGL